MSNASQKRAARKARDAWTSCLDTQAQQAEWTQILSTIDPKDFMLPKERKRLAELPDEFMVYRGYQGNRRAGLSWTLSLEVANMFAKLNENIPKGTVVACRVTKADVYAIILNDELEIIILPKTLNSKRISTYRAVR